MDIKHPPTMNLSWTCKKFNDLSPFELYSILQLRSSVFVVEQHCAYLDADNKDMNAYHLMCHLEDHLAAYSRLIPPGIVYSESSIGRVVSSLSVRKKGIGKILMQKSIETIFLIFGNTPIRIGAQLYLKKFYESFGFIQISAVYLEDDIEHILMQLEPK